MTEYKAVCRKKCTFQGRLWEEGQEYRGAAPPPRHFETLLETQTEENQQTENPPVVEAPAEETPAKKKR